MSVNKARVENTSAWLKLNLFSLQRNAVAAAAGIDHVCRISFVLMEQSNFAWPLSNNIQIIRITRMKIHCAIVCRNLFDPPLMKNLWKGKKSIFCIMCGFLMINNPLRDKDGRIVKRGGKGPRVTE